MAATSLSWPAGQFERQWQAGLQERPDKLNAPGLPLPHHHHHFCLELPFVVCNHLQWVFTCIIIIGGWHLPGLSLPYLSPSP